MKKLLLATALTTLSTFTAAQAETWYPDPTHTDVVITWNHAGFSMQTAKFHEVEGTLDFSEGDIANAKADFSVIVDSVDTGVEALDTELVGENFFNAAEYPAIRFVSTSVEQTGDMTVKATGELTIKDVTGPATFDITVHNMGAHPLGDMFDYNKGEWLGMTATTTIMRSEFGIDTFIPVGSDEITIDINTELRAGGWE
ncbi:YceI family protein [Sulfitobacter sp. HNIBRBA3233]|uniref:YceI family protein n=1 Tax=Sulfitobacter marinivivus TaxID=3158558 RepID=UPI0032E01711